MGKFKLLAVILFFIAVIVSATLFFVGYFKPKFAGVYIETNPLAEVFIDNKQVGRTPYKGHVEPGERIVKLVPDSFEKPLAPYEIRVNLVSGIETVIRREFGESEDMSSGEIISFEKIEKNKTSLVAIALPDSVDLVIDGYQRVVTPYKIGEISPGDHTLAFSARGYFDKAVRVKTRKDYKLTVVVQLALSNQKVEIVPEETPVTEGLEAEDEDRVEILLTPVGYLRVRDEPSSLGKEIGQVKPGEVYRLISEDGKTGWFEIEFEEPKEATGSGKRGWISNQYAKKMGESESRVTPAASPTSTGVPKTTTSP